MLHSAPRTSICFALLLAMLCAGDSANASPPNSPPPAPLDLAGLPTDPLLARTNKAVVLIFLAVDCPVCGRYAPEIGRLSAQFGPQGIRFCLVYPNPDESAEAIRRHLREYQLRLDAVRDPRHVLVKRAKAKVTPQAAVFLPNGRLVYSGRIDNWQVGFGQARAEATQHELAETLQSLLRSKPLAAVWPPAQGCFIPDL